MKATNAVPGLHCDSLAHPTTKAANRAPVVQAQQLLSGVQRVWGGKSGEEEIFRYGNEGIAEAHTASFKSTLRAV